MTKYVLIRDDDISFFSSLRLLENLYGEIFEANIPVNFSVIPKVKVNSSIGKNIYSERDFEYEPFIPSEFREANKTHFVFDKPELIEYIKNSKDLVYVVQHGFNHTPNEFASTNVTEIKQKIEKGKEILKKAFGNDPHFFCAPNDRYSPVSLKELQKNFHGATFGVFSLRNMISYRGLRIPLSMAPLYLHSLLKKETFLVKNGFLVVGHKNCSINPFTDPEQIKQNFKQIIKENNVITIAQHYWEYYFRKETNEVSVTINKKLLDVFLEVVYELKAENAQFLTMAQFYKKIVQ